MSGWVTVTGPPASICALNFGTTDPFDASTLPNRTEISRIRGLPPLLRRQFVIERLAIHFGEPLGQPEHRDRLDRLVGRDHHHRLGARRERGVGDVDRAEDVGLDAFAPVALEDRHMLERGRMKHDIRLEFVHQPHDALAIANIGNPALDDGAGVVRGQRFRHRIERRLGIFDDQQPRGAEGHDTVADLRADRSAAAGDDHRLVLHQGFETRVVDLLARTQQQVLDRNRVSRGASPLSSDGSRLTIRPSRRARISTASGCASGSNADGVITTRLIGLSAPREIADHVLDVVDAAQHRDIRG